MTQDQESALFDIPEGARLLPPPPENLTRGEKRQRLIAKRIATGEHPLGYPVMLHDESSRDIGDRASGPRCGQCKFRVLLTHHDRTYPKCWYPDVDKYPHTRDSHCDSSDIRAWWPACRQFEKRTDT
jgi:hypothetical protein